MKNYLEFEKDIKVLEEELEKLKDPFNKDGISGISEVDTNRISELQNTINVKLRESYKNINDWQRVLLARHEDRAKAKHYIDSIFTNFINLSGDRNFADDQAVITGFAKFEEKSVLVIGQEKGEDLDSRIRSNFGSMGPSGYRKCIRLMKLADKFNIPVITFIDTDGAAPNPESEKRGIAESIASSIECMLSLRVPVIACITGTGGSGGYIALAAANKVLQMENAVAAVISAEGASEIVFKDSTRKIEAAQSLKLTANELLKLGVIDEIIQEPIPAHRDKEQAVSSVKAALRRCLDEFKSYSREEILEHRKEKFLKIGKAKGFASFIQRENGSGAGKTFLNSIIKFLGKNKLSISIILLLILGLSFLI